MVYPNSIHADGVANDALISGALLWVVLGVLLLIASARGGLRGRVAWAALLLHPLAGAAAVVAVLTLSAGTDAPQWPIVPLIVLPLLLGFFAVWVQRPPWLAGLPPAFTSCHGAAIWGLVFVPVGRRAGYVPLHDAQVARRAAAVRRDVAAAAAEAALASRQANLDRFQHLTDASPLWDWQAFIGTGNALEAQAVARVRVLPHRQDDAEAMLRDGKDFPLLHIRELDLQATAAFCASASAFLTANASGGRRGTAR